MMDKDTVLPLYERVDCQNPHFVFVATAQRDADWEHIKPLVETVQHIMVDIEDYQGVLPRAVLALWDELLLCVEQLGAEEHPCGATSAAESNIYIAGQEASSREMGETP